MTGPNRKSRPKMDAEKRRNQILTGAVKAFSKNGYRNTDLQELAEKLGIAKGTIYIYFKSKEHLFLSAVDYSIERLAVRIDAEVKNSEGPLDNIKAIVRAHLSFFNEEHMLAEIIARERGEFKDHAEEAYIRVYSENADRIENIIRQGMKQDIFRKVNVKRATEVLANLLTGTVYTYMFAQRDGNMAGVIEATTDILLNGLLSERTER